MKNLKIYLLVISLISLSSCSGVKKHVRNKIFKEPHSVVLVLGGGGARAIAHLGAIEVLEKNKIPIDVIIGASGGSIAGAIYADCKNAEEARSLMLNYKANEILNFSIISALDGIHTPHISMIDGQKFEQSLSQKLKAKKFHDLKIPFVAVATDVQSGKAVGLDRGSVSRAVRASCSIPGLFAPVLINGQLYVDGCVAEPLPTIIAQKYNPKLIIAIDVNIKVDKEQISNMIDLSYKSMNITYDSFNDLLATKADIVIRPDIKDIGMFEDHRKEELYEAGKEAAGRLIPEIKSLLSN